jgi:hypothetical protein
MAKRGRKKKAATKETETSAAETVTAPAVTETRQRGRKSQYSDEQRAAFVTAIKNGRAAKAPWNEILDAVKTQGYKGSLQYLQKMGSTSGAVKAGGKRGRPKGSKNVARPTAKHGRPAGSGKRGRPKELTARNGARLGDIESIVEKMVSEKISAAMARAVATLEEAASLLRKL